MRSTEPCRLLLTSLVAMCLSTTGCVQLQSLKQPRHTIHYYILDYPAPSVSAPEPPGPVLRIRRFNATALFTTDRIVAQGDSYSPEYEYYHRWAVSPAGMITDLLVRDLTASGLFKA